MQAAQQLQKSGVSQFVLEDMDFGRRYALEKEIRAAGGSLVTICAYLKHIAEAATVISCSTVVC